MVDTSRCDILLNIFATKTILRTNEVSGRRPLITGAVVTVDLVNIGGINGTSIAICSEVKFTENLDRKS